MNESRSCLGGSSIGGCRSDSSCEWCHPFKNRRHVESNTNRSTSTDFFLGPCVIASIYTLPQRFQVVNGTSPLGAGVRILSYIGVTAFSSMIMAALASKTGVPTVYLIWFCSICQIVGFGLLSYILITTEILAAQFGYQALAAFGTGANTTFLMLLSSYCVEKSDNGNHSFQIIGPC